MFFLSVAVLPLRTVTTLYSKFAYEPVSLTGFDSTKVTEAFALKVGQFVLVRVTIKEGLEGWQNDINIGLPSRLYPPTAIFGTYRVNASADISKNSMCVLSTNGTVQFLSEQAYSSSVPYEFVYPIASF